MIVAVTVILAFNVAVICIYRSYMKKKISKQMHMQVNSAVS